MPTLTMLKGLPASGKSTWAKEQKAKRVNKDDLRAMIDNSKWSKENEKLIIALRDDITFSILEGGLDVIVDDTNFSPAHEKRLREIAEQANADFEVKFFDTPYEECVIRDLQRPNPVGKKVIRRMYEANKHLYIQEYTPPENVPSCLIVDIDGTLAHMNGRTPFQYDLVRTDLVDEKVRDLIYHYTQRDSLELEPENYVVIVSGREDNCRQETIDWLTDNRIPFDELHMRKTGDMRDDRIVKKEIFDTWINNRYNVKFVLDDRNRVVEMWRSLGLKVLQVGEGDF